MSSNADPAPLGAVAEEEEGAAEPSSPKLIALKAKPRSLKYSINRTISRQHLSAEDDLPRPSRGHNTMPEFRTGKVAGRMSGHYENAEQLQCLKARRFNSGIFSLNLREDLGDVGHRMSRQPTEKDQPEEEEPLIDHDLIVFEGPDDPTNSQNWPLRTKIIQTMILSFATLVVTFASSVFSTCTTTLERVYGIGQVVATLSTSLFVLGYVVGPLIWGPASEFAGRRNPLLVAYFGFAIFQIPVAVAQNYQTVTICRFLGGVCASGPLSIVAGAFSDYWSTEARGGAIAIFALATFAGPAIGPVMGSFIVDSYLGWRWTAWITCFWAFLMLTIMTAFLKESFAPILLQRKAKKLRYETKRWATRSQLDERQFDAKQILFVYFLRPLHMLAVEPILALLTLYMGFVYGILYCLFGGVPIEFQRNRGWKPTDASLVFIAVFLGAALGSAITWAFSPSYVKKMHASGRIAVPEERCIPMLVGSIIFPVGIFLYGWTSSEYVESYWPSLVGLLLLSTGILLIFLQAINYIVDAFLFYAASAMAANTFFRSLFGAGFPLFTVQLFTNLPYAWACSLLGFLAICMMPIPILFYIYGEKLRSFSKYAPEIPTVAQMAARNGGPQPKKATDEKSSESEGSEKLKKEEV